MIMTKLSKYSISHCANCLAEKHLFRARIISERHFSSSHCPTMSTSLAILLAGLFAVAHSYTAAQKLHDCLLTTAKEYRIKIEWDSDIQYKTDNWVSKLSDDSKCRSLTETNNYYSCCAKDIDPAEVCRILVLA